MKIPKIIQFQLNPLNSSLVVLLDDGTIWYQIYNSNEWTKATLPPVCTFSALLTNPPEGHDDDAPPLPDEGCGMPHAECFCPHCEYWAKRSNINSLKTP